MAETEQFLERCGDLEMQLGIYIRWTKDDPEYLEAKKYNDERQYRVAAMEVKMLVTQRFMEMAKCHMQGTSEIFYILSSLFPAFTEQLGQIIKYKQTSPSICKLAARQFEHPSTN